MKISGSRVEQIDSMSMNLLRLKEQATITAVTQILSSEGKHVINIIHGTPSQLLGSVYKDITFLWEADTESPEYIQAKKRKSRELAIAKAKERKERQRKSLELEIANLEQRIKNAEAGKAKSPKYTLIASIFFLFEGIFLLFLEAFIFSVIALIMGISCLIAWRIDKEETDAANKRIAKDKIQLLHLKKDLEAKQTELSNLKAKK